MGIDSDDSTDYDCVDEDEEDYTDDDNMYPPSPVHNSGGTFILKCFNAVVTSNNLGQIIFSHHFDLRICS